MLVPCSFLRCTFVELRACIFTIALRYCNTIYLKAQEKFYKHHKVTAMSAFFLSTRRGSSIYLPFFSKVWQPQMLRRLVLPLLAQAGDAQHHDGHDVGEHFVQFLHRRV